MSSFAGAIRSAPAPGNSGAGGSGLRLKSTRTTLLSRPITKRGAFVRYDMAAFAPLLFDGVLGLHCQRGKAEQDRND
jgi:hypothetical protein